jgi:redox-sensitive bicupin YhaK (pirin superfamily)
MLHGEVEHGDSMGNKGTISSGDVQWMTAGSGIIHQEMPKDQKGGLLWGFQLWANLPASNKMMSPRYRDIKSKDIPEVFNKNGTKIKIIAGEVEGVKGPVRDIVTDPEYLDIQVPAGEEFHHRVHPEHRVFAYVIEGNGYLDTPRETLHYPETLAILDNGDEVLVSAGDSPVRFLLISGRPLKEPVAWYGPIVMNTQEELEKAFDEYRKGTFIK